jgi:diguanylate cyclase (GGDEF)-like protein
MKTVREVIRRAPVWVNPDHTNESAVVLMRGHNIGGLPVLEGNDIVGMVLYSHLLGADPNAFVRDVMMTGVPSVSPDVSVREAADLMARAAIGRLPVARAGKLIGVITDGDLLPELGRSFDPLTELPWTDTLREWAIGHLKRGMEISLLFFDLDDFGQFNKQFGHVVGDEVLIAVTDVLRDNTDPEVDTLCRYGGDEFCIATVRTAEEATQLGEKISRRVEEIRLPSVQDQVITCCVGQSGGKRTREREHTHFDATLNNLINLASRDCLSRKRYKSAAAGEPAPARNGQAASPQKNGERLRLARIEVARNGRKVRVLVDLQLGVEDASGQVQDLPADSVNRYAASARADTDEDGVLRLVAETTATALRSILPDGYDIVLSDIILNPLANGSQLVTAAGQFINESRSVSIAGSVVVGEDPYHATAAAVLAAVNRSLTPVLGKVKK